MAKSNDSGNQDRQQPPRHRARAKDERDLNAAQREKLAVELRTQGYDFDAIAEQCGYGSRASAYKAWKRALRRIPAPAVADARRRMTLAYDAARQGLWSDFVTGDTEAVKAWVLMDKSERDLFGLDMPPSAAQQSSVRRVYEHR